MDRVVLLASIKNQFGAYSGSQYYSINSDVAHTAQLSIISTSIAFIQKHSNMM